ncbi:winged helix-turn-helix transcriptional regulator [Streptomyces sp. NBC_01092]|uniref:winged helix-turn-helix transcriptional regulator n=1 Tax=Streptomyces sp. NBC_01092 TaxID=2903748 RepID=UPI00386B50E6
MGKLTLPVGNCVAFHSDHDGGAGRTIGTLSSGRLRFSELQRGIPGVSQRMLTLKLRGPLAPCMPRSPRAWSTTSPPWDAP